MSTFKTKTFLLSFDVTDFCYLFINILLDTVLWKNMVLLYYSEVVAVSQDALGKMGRRVYKVRLNTF